MKNWLILTGVLLSLVLVGSTACSQASKVSTAQQVKVERGDLSIKVSGSGTVEVSHEADLTFGTSGRIIKLFVKEGDDVSQGEIIAKLETDSLELALAQAMVTYAQTQLSVNQSALAVTQAQLAVTQAGINVKSAEIALEQTIKTSSVSDIRIAQADLDTAKRNLADSLTILTAYIPGSVGYNEYQKNVVLAQARVKAAQDRLDAMLGGFSNDEVAVKQQQVTAAQQSLAAAQQSLDIAKLSADFTRQSLELAGLSRDYAQKQLEKATLSAPFAGTITSLPADEGDSVLPTTRIAHLVEPGRMELKIQVDEIDIPGVKIGQRAIVKVDALPDTLLAGKVSYITPLPKKEAGVTLFDVKIGLESANNTGLRAGMSASADIVITERNNILLVPDRVVKQNSQGKDILNVVVNGQTEEMVVVTGISDGFQTEIISGIKEGEIVVENRAQ
ncbi:MAG: hypothetical protein A2Z28_06205 [Chloroflexi bacterium RBG_16_51_9]|nr:MAG: hypothetical protein A2Z28_06205 [Chloroflexi bacterium RBG_16_51_9]